MEDTSAGFYFKNEDTLLYAMTAVHSPGFILLIENKDDYNYPVEGWYYFNSRQEALTFFNIEEE